MSTVDPQAVKADRARRAQGSAGALAWTVIVGLVVVAAAFLVGLGVAAWAGLIRDLSINAVEDWADEDSLQISLIVVGTGGGPLGVVAASMLYSRVVAPRWTGGPRPVIGPFFLIMIGTMAGTAVGALSMPAAVTVGYTLDEGSARTWWFGDWLWYYEPIWLPALLGVGAVIAVIAPFAARRRRARTSGWEHHLKRTGVKRIGTVSDVQYTGLVVDDVPRVRVTVAYTDATGVKRWVTKKGSRRKFQSPVPGQEVTVWYDPARPADQSRILIDFSPVSASRGANRRGRTPKRPAAPTPATGASTPQDRGTHDSAGSDGSPTRGRRSGRRSPDAAQSHRSRPGGWPGDATPSDERPSGARPIADAPVADAPVADFPMTDAPTTDEAGAHAPDWGTPIVERLRATARILTVNEQPESVDGRSIVHLRLGLRVKPKDGGAAFLSNTTLTVPAGVEGLAALRRKGTALPVLYTPGQLGEVTILPSYLARLAGR